MVAIVTGASKGIGLAISHKLASMGYDLGICSRSESEIAVTSSEISVKYGVKAIGYAVDMSHKGKVIEFGQQLLQDWGSIDVLINNAGVFYPGETLKEEDGRLEEMIETNLYSAYHLSRALIPTMIVKGKGHVINMCSIASQIAYPNGGSYSISKFALLGFSKVLREELKPHGVKVTAIMPGATWSHSWQGVDLPETRLMQSEDIAKIVATVLTLSDSATIEDIVLRPQLGDL